jgi:hypothetical protein
LEINGKKSGRGIVVINRPNQPGRACEPDLLPMEFKDESFQLGLPNFIQSYFNGLEPGPNQPTDCREANITLFPNPAGPSFQTRLASECFEPYVLTVFDALGRVILTRAIAEAVSEKLMVGYLAAGLYLVEMRFSDRRVTKKLVKN